MQVVLDVSEYQSLDQLRSLLSNAMDEIVGVYIKATQGVSYRDELAAAFAACCLAHNTAFGYYDFLTDDQASEQAAYFKSFVANQPLGSLMPMLDCEGGYSKYATGVEHWQQTYGEDVVVYASLSNMSRYADLPNPKWVAQYDSSIYYRPSDDEIKAYGDQGYVLWQFTANYMGKNQDASVVVGDFSTLKAT